MSGKREIADALLHLPPSSPAWGYDDASGVHYLVDGWRIANIVASGDKWQLSVTWGAMDTARTMDDLREAKRFCEAFGVVGGATREGPPLDENEDLVVELDALPPGRDDPDVQ